MMFPVNPVVGLVVSHAAGDMVVRVLEFRFRLVSLVIERVNDQGRTGRRCSTDIMLHAVSPHERFVVDS